MTEAKKTVAKATKSWEKKELQWFKRHETDTGSPEYQVFLITERIAQLQWHLKVNHKDYDAKRTLLRLVSRRRQHLKYLKSNNLDRYVVVSKKLGLKG